MFMNDLKKLKVWQMAMQVTKEVYRLAEKLPTVERYGLKSQLCRCAISVPSNIAEGAGRNTRKDFARFLGIASGSLYELETQILISCELILFEAGDCRQVLANIEELHKMLYAFKKRLTENPKI